MNVQEALADLMEVSSQVQAAVVLEADGTPEGATVDAERATALAGAARALLDAATRLRPSVEQPVTQLEAATREGSLFLVADGERAIAATTGPLATTGLVFYDLKTCLRYLRRAEEQEEAEKAAAAQKAAAPRRRRKQAAEEETGDAAS
jgi:predicted regulator of Ras-like GTPase activity (Roadblock/LC7/MglB family)